MSKQPLRTRFAPSPTGLIHIGGIRTMLFAWLYARQNKGQFVLRLEDTDRERFDEAAEAQILEVLDWLGLNHDEGPDIGGDFEPYRQSDRLDSYLPYALDLIKQGKAYADPTPSEKLTEYREQAKAEKRPFHYREHRPTDPPAWTKGMPIRLKIDELESPEWFDLVRGKQASSTDNIDDFILIKADGYPTYNFAHIIDDHEMKINLVVRGDEFVSSMPKFLLLYKALEIEVPQFAHVPAVWGETGNKKLSKRDGDVDTLLYRDKGYLPEALLNFLALLGWNDGTEQELFSIDELIKKFDFSRVQSSPARFNQDRLDWINGTYIRNQSFDELKKLAENFWPDYAMQAEDEYRDNILKLVQDRLKYMAELPELVEFFFKAPTITLDEVLESDKQLRKKLEPTAAKQIIADIIEVLNSSDFSVENLEKLLRNYADSSEHSTGVIFKLIRISVTGQIAAPPLFDTLQTLGKTETLARLNNV
ncbi:glutamate--tRNA ligase [Candidatus Saccharibacteria bacterium]|nr:glutamate--tRNA ligase [Candidatus Saccharibacteria bacterium]